MPAHVRTALPRPLETIVDTARRGGIPDAATAARLLTGSSVTPDDLAPWAAFDHPAADGYGRRPVVVTDTFELMVMSWNPGDFSAIHDHGHTQWGAVKVFGVAEHATFEIRGGTLRTTERLLTGIGQVQPVDHDLIHQMGNPGRERFLSLHLYGLVPQTASSGGGVTGDARIFDLLNNQIVTTNGGVFHNLDDEHVTSRRTGLPADIAAVREHHHQMLDQLTRVRLAEPTTASETDLIVHRLQNELHRLDSAPELAA